ncbi:hypothetical protein BV25DRAFT_1986144 [Artomyces pyxidatus]|uniref:Uncharacterized protein n=1 Tax=Artomyces pyxidatus TaxID=48021 RepID=A0ACB8TJJ1_9AGAM|nr:hypothetical protein BV25DRAFT_1986144 [Artomyces pyxidatus]
MNKVREINKINERELELGLGGASWHDEYKDSAYIFVGGLHFDLTEGDVITIFSQYGEVADVNLPRDKETGKSRGFGFLMYEDQRSTILAVDNLNGASVLDRTLSVDHVKNYKQPRVKGEDGEWMDIDEPSLNAKAPIIDDAASESSASSAPDIDPDDPMRDFLLQKWREERGAKKSKKSKSKSKHKNETPEERKARKERKKEKKARKLAGKSEGLKGVEALLKTLDSRGDSAPRNRRRSISPSGSARRSRSRSLPQEDKFAQRGGARRPRSRSPSPRRYSPYRGDRSKRYGSADDRDASRSPDARIRRRPND